jgi:hypothetical protein
MTGLPIRVADRFLASRTKLHLGPGKPEVQATRVLQARDKLVAKNRGDLHSAVESAGHHAKKQGKTMFVYFGNSYGRGVWRVSAKSSEYLDPINNTGDMICSVSPTLEVAAHELTRS